MLIDLLNTSHNSSSNSNIIVIVDAFKLVNSLKLHDCVVSCERSGISERVQS